MQLTIKAKIERPSNWKKESIESLFRHYKDTVLFYLGILKRGEAKGWSKAKLAVLLERLTVKTKGNVDPKYNIKSWCRLPCALRQSARDKAIEMWKSWRKTKGRRPKLNSISIRYTKRAYAIGQFDLRATDNKMAIFFASVVTLDGRIKVPLKMARYQEDLLKDCKISSAELVSCSENLFLSVVVEKEVPKPDYGPKSMIGIDIGISRLSVATEIGSRKTFFLKDGRWRHLIRRYREKYRKGKSKKQKAALGQKIGRINNHFAHLISRWNVEVAKRFERPCIVLEDLEIEPKKGGRRKGQNQELSMWLRGRIIRYTEYKARGEGIQIIKVNPKYTSQACPRCGYVNKKNRRSQTVFRCRKCGYENNADRVASLNVGLRGLFGPGISSGPEKAAVNQLSPMIAVMQN